MKENQSIKPVYDFDNKRITWELRNMPPLTLDITKVHQDNIQRAAYVGLGQVRVVDAAAIGVADKNGRIIPAAERLAMKHKRMAAIIAHLESGSPVWNVKGEPGASSNDLITRALMRTREETREQVMAKVARFAGAKFEGDNTKALKHLALDPKVAAAMLDLQREAIVTTAIDADSALDGLE